MFPVNESLTKLDAAFPASVSHLMPKYDEIRNDPAVRKYEGLVSRWFFEGLRGATFEPRDGVNKEKAMRHLGCIMGSFEPSHEHKTAAVAYLLDQWFSSVTVPEKKAAKR